MSGPQENLVIAPGVPWALYDDLSASQRPFSCQDSSQSPKEVRASGRKSGGLRAGLPSLRLGAPAPIRLARSIGKQASDAPAQYDPQTVKTLASSS